MLGGYLEGVIKGIISSVLEGVSEGQNGYLSFGFFGNGSNLNGLR